MGQLGPPAVGHPAALQSVGQRAPAGRAGGGRLVYAPVSRILGGLLALFNDYYVGWVKAAEVVGALAVLGFIGWLYSRAILER